MGTVHVLTGHVGTGKDWSVTQVVLQSQVSNIIQTSIGWEAQPETVAKSKLCHQPGGAAILAARAARCIHCGGVGQRSLDCSLRTRQKRYNNKRMNNWREWNKSVSAFREGHWEDHRRTYHGAVSVVCDGEGCRQISFNARGVLILHLKSNSMNATWIQWETHNIRNFSRCFSAVFWINTVNYTSSITEYWIVWCH